MVYLLIYMKHVKIGIIIVKLKMVYIRKSPFLIGSEKSKRKDLSKLPFSSGKIGLQKVLRNNRQEPSAHRAFKQYLGKKCHMVESINYLLNDIIIDQQLERIRAKRDVEVTIV